MKITGTTRLQDFGLLVLRLSIGGLLILHGLAKLFHGHDFIRGMLAEKACFNFYGWVFHLQRY